MSLTVALLLAVAAGCGLVTWALATGKISGEMPPPRRLAMARVTVLPAPAPGEIVALEAPGTPAPPSAAPRTCDDVDPGAGH